MTNSQVSWGPVPNVTLGFTGSEDLVSKSSPVNLARAR